MQLAQKLTPNDAVSAQPSFGEAVAISGDGTTAVIGARFDNGNVGNAWVFTRSGTVWSQQGAKLPVSGEIGVGNFGQSVAVSADGNTVLVGAPSDNSDQGAAFVFTRSGNTWTQQRELTGAAGGTQFGSSVALSADGNTALIGSPSDAPVGSASVFTRSASTWSPQGPKLTPSDAQHTGAPVNFGSSVALSSDGGTALIGGEGDNNQTGAAWIFARGSGGAWAQQGGKLSPKDAAGNPEFGLSVSLSSDGNTALIGGPFDNNETGAAWVFARLAGGTFAQQGSKLTGPAAGSSALFGHSVALSGDGNTALVGAPSGGATGDGWQFTRSGSTWVQRTPILVPADARGSNNAFGSAVGLSSDGSQAMIGGDLDNGSYGAAWPFSNPASAPAGDVLAFGHNNFCQLGNCGLDDAYGAVVNNLPGAVRQVATGGCSGLAVLSNGQLYGWGCNYYDQIGVQANSGTNFVTGPVPVSLPGQTGTVVAVAAGNEHSLAVTSTGQLYAMGLDDHSQVVGAANNNPNPPALVTLPNATGPVVAVAAGEADSFALTSTGQLYAFGDDGAGQLGLAPAGMLYPTPKQVTLPAPASSVAAGQYHTLVLTSDGKVYAFGLNNEGQLGNATNNGSGTANPTPTLVSLPGATGPVSQIVAGHVFSVALTSTNQLYGFGYDYFGQVGPGLNAGTNNPNPVPAEITVPGATGPVTQIGAGANNTSIVTSSGQLFTLGDNVDGQLGRWAGFNSSAAPNTTPTQVVLAPGTTIDSVARGPEADFVLAVAGDLAITTASLPAGVTGAAYSAPLAASGGTPPLHWTASGLPKGVAVNGSTISGTPTAAGRFSPTVTVTDADGSSVSGSLSLTVTSPHAPVIGKISQSVSRWVRGRAAATITANRKRKLPVGTTFRFTLDQSATLKLSFTRPGRRVGKHCMAAATTHGKRKCTIVAGTLGLTGHAGTDRVGFDGRFGSGKELAPGTYELVVTATNLYRQPSVRSGPRFTIAGGS
jgi:alpha-tubulin suppressor-like RCC1 family protein